MMAMKEAACLARPKPNSGLPAEVGALAPWFHNLHLPDATQTAPDHPLGDFPTCKWRLIKRHLPARLKGWSVLDLGCNAGFYSIELARRGARVLAIDREPHFLRQAQWAVGQHGLSRLVELRQMQVYEVVRLRRQFDLVLFMGLFYHLRHPLLGLDIVAEKTKRLLLFQTLTMPGERVMRGKRDYPINRREMMLRPGWPKMAFIEKSLAGDFSNWWAPNHACVEAMLRSAGMRHIRRLGHEIYLCRPAAGGADAAVTEELDAAAGRPAMERLNLASRLTGRQAAARPVNYRPLVAGRAHGLRHANEKWS